MKNLHHWLVFLLGMFMFTLAQAQDDLQWFILNGKGKDGILTNVLPPQNNFAVIMNNDSFNIDGYYHPQTQPGKNDFLVIYTDGTYFNSRGVNSFFPKPTGASNVSSHNFIIPSGKSISALYTTRNYEGDDPPDKIKLANQPDGNASTYALGVTTPDSILTANHAIVRNRDVTLIINLNALRLYSQMTSAALTGMTRPNYFLRATLIDNNGIPVSSVTNCLDENPVFYQAGSLTEAIPRSAYSPARVASEADTVSTNQIGSFLYLNLRPTTSLNTYFSDSTGNQSHKIRFELKDASGKVVASLIEPLLEAFDPNLLNVTGVCTTNVLTKYVEYKVEFENTGTMAVNNLAVIMHMPEHIVDICTNGSRWMIGGKSFGVNIRKTNCGDPLCLNTRTFRLTPDSRHVLEGCGSIDTLPAPLSPQDCKSVLTVKAKLNTDMNIAYANVYPITGLIPDSCFVAFHDGNEMKIEILTYTEIIHPELGGVSNEKNIPRLLQASLCEACNSFPGWLNKNIRISIAAGLALTLALLGIRLLWRPKIPKPQ